MPEHDLAYPIGRFEKPSRIDGDVRESFVRDIEAAPAILRNAVSGPIDASLNLLASIHARGLACIRGLPAAALGRTFRHPDLGAMSLDEQLDVLKGQSRFE